MNGDQAAFFRWRMYWYYRDGDLLGWDDWATRFFWTMKNPYG